MGCPGGMSTIWYTRSAFMGKSAAVCSSPHCGTRYLIAFLAHPTAQVSGWAGTLSGDGEGGGGSVRFLGDFGVVLYPPSVVARQSHCAPALLSIVMSFGHCTDHCPWLWAPEKKMSCIFWMSGNIQEVSNLLTLLVSQFTRKLYPCSNSCAPTLYISHSI